MADTLEFKNSSFKQRLSSMLAVDVKRTLRSRLFYIILACSLVAPILITVMITMMEGTVTVDPQTGVSTVMKGLESVWQTIGALPGDGTQSTGMDVISMCNINMMFMLSAVFICLFISDDFRSGYAKNLFTVRATKSDYVISKTVTGFACGALMLICYFTGAMIGGAISSLPFELGTLSAWNILACMISKILLMLVFIAIFVLVSVAAKDKAWLALCGSLGAGMLLFMMVSMITPLNSTVMNVILCLAGGLMFALGLGAISCLVLKKTRLV